MQVIFLGTNGWYDSATGNTICVLIRAGDLSIVLDAGNGIARLDRYSGRDRPTYIFLSHFHLDHIVGLHILNKFSFSAGLTICGQEGTRDVLDRIVSHPFSMPLARLNYPTTVLELPREVDRLPFRVQVLPMTHAAPTIGFRIEVEGRVVAYCPDTGYCANAVELSGGADLLIAECAYLPGETSEGWPHLNPQSAARIARESGARRLALVHFDASRYSSFEARSGAERAAREIFPDTFSARDDMMVEVERGGLHGT